MSLSLGGFLSLLKLSLFLHEYLSNCYDWALIKLAACFPKEENGTNRAGDVQANACASSTDFLKLWVAYTTKGYL